MEYASIASEIKKGVIRPVYLLYGDETYLARQAEKTIIEAVLSPEERETSLTVLENNPDPAYLVGLIETSPFFGGKNLIVLRESSLLKPKRGSEDGEGEDKQDKDSGANRLQGIISQMPDYSIIVFTVSGKVDKRKKLYKVIEQSGAVVEFGSPKIKDAKILVLEKLEQLNKRMAPDALEYYLGVLSMMPKISVAMIYSELDKMALYVGDSSTIKYNDLTEIMAAVPEVNVFEMTEALSRKEIRQALELLHSQVACGEHPIKILGLMAFHVRRLWQIKEITETGGSARDISDILKIHSFIAERLFRQSKGFSMGQLRQALLQLASADRALKSGRASSSILEKIMIELCDYR